MAYNLLELAKKANAGKAWDSAFKQAISEILNGLKDEKKSPLRVLTTPSIREALVEPFIVAGVETIDAVRQAWDQSAGLDMMPAELNLIVKNIRANTKSAPLLIRSAMLNGPKEQTAERLNKLAKEMRQRAEYAVQYAQSKGKTVQALSGMKVGGRKTWASHGPKCSACKALVGTTLKKDEVFSAAAGGLKLGTFGSLLGPPRHPNCNCFLVIT